MPPVPAVCLLLGTLASAWALAPKWTPTYSMPLSTIAMTCNTTGSDPSKLTGFGIVDYDWSESKDLWSKATPMNCEETMLAKAKITHSLNPAAHAWVYRNSIKALPWFTLVREKLADQAYWGWFLANKGCNPAPGVYTCGTTATTNLYHDFEQTPRGDCGEGIECGEYLFDLRNTSVQAWLAGEYLLGPTGLGSPAITGFYFDDDWSKNGPSEENPNAVNATGLTPADVEDLVTAWGVTMNAMIQSSVKAGGFVWGAFLGGQQTAPGRNQTDPRADCAQWIRSYCGPNGQFLSPDSALFFGFTRIAHTEPLPLPAFEQDLATFLIVRGPYAWLGYGWIGCDKNDEYPAALSVDYGVPTGVCTETGNNTGVFTREWSKATVTMDCPNWQASITMKA